MTAPFRARIIVVNDEPIVARELAERLREFGYDVAGTARTGDEALALAERTLPDLALLDLAIEGPRDSLATANALRDRLRVAVLYSSEKAVEFRMAVELALARVRLERTLDALRSAHAATLHAVDEALIFVDRTGAISELNRAASALTGLTLERVRERPCDDVLAFVKGRSREPLENPLNVTLRERARTILPGDALLRSATGGEIAVEGAATPLEDAAGKLRGAILVLRDVTEERRLKRQVGLNDQLAALGALAAGVTQELSNPLAFVIGNQQHARRQLAPLRELCDELGPKRAELARELCQEIDSALSAATSGAERVRAIGAELRKLGRPTSSRKQTCDVRAALDRALSITHAQLSARARVIREFEVCPPASVDEVQLTRVFVNLLSNAAQAIVLGAESRNEIRLAARTGAHGGALIEVKDSGSGINKADLPRIFEPFFTTREGEGGAGLGLSIARGIVTSCGGSIEVESRVGAGSTFRVLLPASGEDAAAAVRGKRSARGKASPQPDLAARLLFIDDEPILLDALTRALEGHYAVQRASGASAALDLLADGNEYDLLVCDLMMPDVSGMDLFRAIQQRFPASAQRMVFMTGGAFTLPAQEFISEKGRRVLEKPFTNDELFAFIAACLDAFGRLRPPADAS